MKRRFVFFVIVAAIVTSVLSDRTLAQVTSDRLLRASEEPQNWITYSGGYAGLRHSPLTQITPANVKNLELKWILPNQVFGAWQSSPIVVDGMMYVTQRPNDVLAVDAKTGRVFWQYRYTVSPDARVCCGANNRGVAILGDSLFMGTLDGHLVAIDRTSGRSLWDVPVGDPKLGYSITMAPLIVKDKVLVGSGGGEYGIRGFIAAFDAKTGKELWRFYTIPGPGEKGHDTWSGDSWKSGGASVWVTPSYDPALNLTYWGVGNPGPDFNPDQRPGDNLYSDSVVALDPDTGALKWHFQFSPHDPYDYDSVQVGVLADLNWKGTPTKAILWGNRNGFFYVLDRTNGKFLSATPFVKVNWASGIDDKGRPDSDATARGAADVARCAGRHQLVLPVVQSSNRAVLSLGLGWVRVGLQARDLAVRAGTKFPRRRCDTLCRNGRRARRARGTRDANQQLDGCCGQRRRDRDRSADGSEEVDLQAVRRDGQRQPDDRDRSPLYRRARGILLCARRADRGRAVESEPRRSDRQRPDDLRRGRQAVRRGDLGQFTHHVRTPRLNDPPEGGPGRLT